MAIAVSGSGLWTGGLAMIIISCLVLVVGVVLGILICAGVLSGKKQGGVVQPAQGGPMVITTTSGGQQQQHQQHQQHHQPPPQY
jgi:hypothetical protein